MVVAGHGQGDNRPVFATDVGGVLSSQQHDGPPVEGSLEILTQLSTKCSIWIVSMCGKLRARETKKWLYNNDFTSIIPESRQIYIPFSAGNKNVPLRQIEAAFFVDDRLKHIGPATGIMSLKCFWFTPSANYAHISGRYTAVSSWADILRQML